MLYRDSQGRTRREQSFSFPGDASGKTIKTVMISDPVAGFSYSLNPDTREGHKSSIFRFERTPAPAKAGGEPPRPGAPITVSGGGAGGFVITSGEPGGVARSENSTFSF